MPTVPGSPFTNPLIQLLGYALGVGVGPILRPGVQDILNEAWSLHPVRRPDAMTLAAGVALKQVLLSPAELAVMVQRTVVPNPGLLPNQPDTAGSNVPPMPVVDIDVLAEAAAAGINPERMAALTRIIGLPASPDLAARM